MSEELPVPALVAETPPTKMKNYLLMVDELTVAFLSRIIPNIKYVEVEGMNITDNPKVQILVNPLAQPIETPTETVDVQPA